MSSLRLLTPNTSLCAAIALLFACATIAPQLVYKLSNDGGFIESGEQINLGRWTHISANRNNSAVPGINRPDGNPPAHMESWINAGQWLRFDHVLATKRSLFSAEVRVHPQWPRDRATPVTFSVTAEGKKSQSLTISITPDINDQTEWARIELDLSPMAGTEVNIKVAPTADQEVRTLLRDPQILIAPPLVPAPSPVPAV